MKKELVTIAIPTYNRLEYLREAISSVVTQTYTNIEIIVSDNASTQSTYDVVQSFQDSRIRYIQQTHNIGMVGNWNACLEQAKGEYFLLLSDDDILDNRAVENLLNLFEDQHVVLAYGPVSYMNDKGNMGQNSPSSPSIEDGESFIRFTLKEKRTAFPSATMFKTNVAKKVGNYPEVGSATDLALHLSIATQGKIAFFKNPVAIYRVHDHNLSRSIRGVLESLRKLFAWSSNIHSPMYLYNAAVGIYCSNYLYMYATRKFVRSEDTEALIALDAARSFKINMKSEYICTLMSLPVVRKLAAIRRKTMKLI